MRLTWYLDSDLGVGMDVLALSSSLQCARVEISCPAHHEILCFHYVFLTDR